MFYPDNETGIDVMPEIAPKQSNTVKWFTKGGKGVEPTVPGQDTWNIWQAELLNILNLANIKPDKTKLDQIAQAIKLIASAAIEKEVGEGKFLEVDKNLAEIAAKSNAPAAQEMARKNIGIDGDIAYRDKENTFAKPNTFSDEVTVENTLNIGKLGTTATWGIHFARSSTYILPYKNSAVPTMVGLDIKQMLNQGKAKWRIWCTDARSLALVMDGVENYPVLSVNNAKPDTRGNVNVSAGTTYSNSASKSANGWFRDSSTGVIRQWGIGALNTTISFPMAFPGACTSVQAIYLDATPDDALSVLSVTNTSFNPYNYWGNSGQSVIWAADGY
ncbi:hypothetical protein CI266_002190 [Salmonella enterica subsp. enterica serovar Kotte]|nr:hypothetical protein [Salmonella enterica subsp. enterica serovar Kotte]